MRPVDVAELCGAEAGEIGLCIESNDWILAACSFQRIDLCPQKIRGMLGFVGGHPGLYGVGS